MHRARPRILAMRLAVTDFKIGMVDVLRKAVGMTAPAKMTYWI